jgi:hypothetical protein
MIKLNNSYANSLGPYVKSIKPSSLSIAGLKKALKNSEFLTCNVNSKKDAFEHPKFTAKSK